MSHNEPAQNKKVYYDRSKWTPDNILPLFFCHSVLSFVFFKYDAVLDIVILFELETSMRRFVSLLYLKIARVESPAASPLLLELCKT